MKTGSKSRALVVPAVLLALFTAGSAAGSALALPLPSSLVGLALVLLGLRLGVMATAVAEPAVRAPTAVPADVLAPPRRAA